LALFFLPGGRPRRSAVLSLIQRGGPAPPRCSASGQSLDTQNRLVNAIAFFAQFGYDVLKIHSGFLDPRNSATGAFMFAALLR
jgi:hypothetical protein